MTSSVGLLTLLASKANPSSKSHPPSEKATLESITFLFESREIRRTTSFPLNPTPAHMALRVASYERAPRPPAMLYCALTWPVIGLARRRSRLERVQEYHKFVP